MRFPQVLYPQLVALAMLMLSPTAANASDGTGPTLDLRYRYEHVSDDAFADDANAQTLRVRLGYRWAITPTWTAYADGEYVTHLFNEQFNSSTNGRPRYPVVPDPDETELNQAFVSYADGGLKASVGRQRLLFDNQRFIGNVGWRQNEQTFDALDLSYRVGEAGPTVRYSYLDRVHRVFGDHHPQGEWNLDGHAFNVSQALSLGTLSGYAYLIDNNAVATGSLASYGLRWSATHALASGWKLGLTAEAAHQKDYADNPSQISADYRFIEPTLGIGEFTLKAGYELLDGNGSVAFQTPLATLHAFNGWADRFLTTPVNGLQDIYAGVGGKHGQWSWLALWHDFSADRGNDDYGTEFDAQLGYAFTPAINALVKLADYRSDGFASDETKLWLSMEYRY